MKEYLESKQSQFLKPSEKPKHPVFCVTPVSKYLALALFVILPFLGGYIGYVYAPEKVVEVVKIVEVTKTDQVNSTETNDALNSEMEFVSVTLFDIESFKQEDCSNNSSFYEVFRAQSEFENFVQELTDCNVVFLNEKNQQSGDAFVLFTYPCGACAEFYALDSTNTTITSKLDSFPFFSNVAFTLDYLPDVLFGVAADEIYRYDIRNGDRTTIYSHTNSNESLLWCEYGCSADVQVNVDNNQITFRVRVIDTSYPFEEWGDTVRYKDITVDL